MRYELVIRQGPNQGRKIPLRKQTLIIGRDVTADICIKDPELSRKHCRLIRGSSYQVQDLGSTNGTFIDGVRMASQEAKILVSGQTIQMGANVQLVYNEIREDEKAIMSTMATSGVKKNIIENPGANVRTDSATMVGVGQQDDEEEDEEEDENRRRLMIGLAVGGGLLLCCIIAAVGGGIAYSMGLF